MSDVPGDRVRAPRGGTMSVTTGAGAGFDLSGQISSLWFGPGDPPEAAFARARDIAAAWEAAHPGQTEAYWRVSRDLRGFAILEGHEVYADSALPPNSMVLLGPGEGLGD